MSHTTPLASPGLKGRTAGVKASRCNVEDLLRDTNNKRRHERTAFTAQVQVFEIDDSGAVVSSGVDARAFDLSRGGIGLHARRMYYAKARVALLIPRTAEGPRILAGVVRYSRYLDKGLYHIGVEFRALPTTLVFTNWMQARRAEAEGVKKQTLSGSSEL